MEIYLLQVGLGYIIDLVIGDPSRSTHPVIIIGKCIAGLEKLTRTCFNSPLGLKLAGLLTALLIITGSYLAVYLVLMLVKVNSYLHVLVASWLISTTIATRGLADAAKSIKKILATGNIKKARTNVGWIVGRDTHDMDSGEVSRATIETVAENLVDAVIAPIFYAMLGGPALAMAYRAINTLDSMLGYKNEKYLHYGWASARLDDIAGYIPARIAGFSLLAAAWLSNRNYKLAKSCWFRDAGKHPSPNGGIPESVMAGALGIRLGGRNSYGGVVSHRQYMGENCEALRPDHIGRAIDMLYLGSLIGLISCGCLNYIFWILMFN